jgi:hypothetical protein
MGKTTSSNSKAIESSLNNTNDLYYDFLLQINITIINTIITPIFWLYIQHP